MGRGWRSIAGGSGRPGRQDLGEVEADGLLQLVVGAGAGVPVGAPADELGGVAEPAALQMVIADLDHPLGPQRRERQLLARIPAAAVGAPPGPPLGLGLPPPGAPVQGWPSKVVTSGWSSANSSRRRSIGKAPITPAMASSPSWVYSPSSSEPTRSVPRLCSR